MNVQTFTVAHCLPAEKGHSGDWKAYFYSGRAHTKCETNYYLASFCHYFSFFLCDFLLVCSKITWLKLVKRSISQG